MTTPMPQYPRPSNGEMPYRSIHRDRSSLIATIILLVLYGIGLVITVFLSLYFPAGTDAYGNTVVLLLDQVAPLVFALSCALAVWLIVSRRSAIWVPLVGMVINTALFVMAYHYAAQLEAP